MELEGGDFSEGLIECSDDCVSNVSGLRERHQDRDVRRHALARRRIEAAPQSANDRFSFWDEHHECGDGHSGV